MPVKLQTHIQFDFGLGTNALFLKMDIPGNGPDSGVFFAEQVAWKKRDPSYSGPRAPFVGETYYNVADNIRPSMEDFLQTMLNTAWDFGQRPAGFKDHTNELTAVRYHLEDMRTLALGRKR